MDWHLYILECSNGELYTGISQNTKERFLRHMAGKGGRFTKGNQPLKILYQENPGSLEAAKNREIQIKKWSRTKKLALTKGDLQELKRLSISRD